MQVILYLGGMALAIFTVTLICQMVFNRADKSEDKPGDLSRAALIKHLKRKGGI